MSIGVFWEDMIIQPYNQRTNGLEQGLSWEYRNDFDEKTVRFYWKAAYPYNNPINYVDVELWFYAGQPGPAFIFYNTIIGTGTGNLGSQCRSCKLNLFCCSCGVADKGCRWEFKQLRRLARTGLDRCLECWHAGVVQSFGISFVLLEGGDG